ncbi:REP-associated tyrosine transposase [Spirosoma rhododendri]|uniref:Transposase IS200-like domain-containing protein n=1 Tax=Spirosoma rhododendri TaxID=2728024 RepID=A0A7L5DH53_9BACT|nr:transposase [Spirosoma rhododendri]QJD77626.1 hypothetical protein HH216_03745 [Spirosoma rhododendri]
MLHTDFYRSRLPHIQPLGGTFFVTTRLYGSVPQIEKQRLSEDFLLRKQQIIARRDHTPDELDRLTRQYFAAYETILEKSNFGPKWLAVNAIAEQIARALHYFDAKRYELIAYCLMSNHVHVVFTLNDEAVSLQQVMHSLKSFTASKCNELLDRTGAFWEHESYDRLVRDRAELHRIVQYVLHNPVKAGLCQCWQDWKWTYIKPEYNDFT